MDSADNAVRSECRGVAKAQQTDTSIVNPEGLGSGKNTPGACPDGWRDPKNVDDRGGGHMGRDTDYSVRRFGEDENVDNEATGEYHGDGLGGICF